MQHIIEYAEERGIAGAKHGLELIIGNDTAGLKLIKDNEYIGSDFQHLLRCIIRFGNESGSKHVGSLFGDVYRFEKDECRIQANSGYVKLARDGDHYRVESGSMGDAKCFNEVVGGAVDEEIIKQSDRYKFYEKCEKKCGDENSCSFMVYVCMKVLDELSSDKSHQIFKSIRIVKNPSYTQKSFIKIVFHLIFQPVYNGTNFIVPSSSELEKLCMNTEVALNVYRTEGFNVKAALGRLADYAAADEPTRKVIIGAGILATRKTAIANASDIIGDEYGGKKYLGYADLLSFLLYKAGDSNDTFHYSYSDTECNLEVDSNTLDMIQSEFTSTFYRGLSVR